MRKQLFEKYNLENETYTSRELGEIVHNLNMANKWDINKFISFDVITKDRWQINFWGQAENIEFVRVENTNQFKAIA